MNYFTRSLIQTCHDEFQLLRRDANGGREKEAELDAKFSYLVGLRAGEDKARELAQVLKRLDTVSNVAEVMVQLELPEARIDEVRA